MSRERRGVYFTEFADGSSGIRFACIRCGKLYVTEDWANRHAALYAHDLITREQAAMLKQDGPHLYLPVPRGEWNCWACGLARHYHEKGGVLYSPDIPAADITA